MDDAGKELNFTHAQCVHIERRISRMRAAYSLMALVGMACVGYLAWGVGCHV